MRKLAANRFLSTSSLLNVTFICAIFGFLSVDQVFFHEVQMELHTVTGVVQSITKKRYGRFFDIRLEGVDAVFSLQRTVSRLRQPLEEACRGPVSISTLASESKKPERLVVGLRTGERVIVDPQQTLAALESNYEISRIVLWVIVCGYVAYITGWVAYNKRIPLTNVRIGPRR